MYDLLIVGAGITAATIVAKLRTRLRICVVDCRDHIGGNCSDYASDGTYIHQFGPHIFHCPSTRIVTFLNEFTEWVPHTHRVIAEIHDAGEFRYVPFPYCRQTIEKLGRSLTESEIIDRFFRGYSQKMWGLSWEQLPQSVRARIPVAPSDEPLYYRDRFVALPRRGYTHMLANMLDGAELILGAPPNEWMRIQAKSVIYTGRPDLIPVPGGSETIGRREGLTLGYRTLDISWGTERLPTEAICLHACSTERPWTRKTCFSRMTGGTSNLISTEFPRQAEDEDLSPFYPIELPQNLEKFAVLSREIGRHYPNLHLAGRLGSFRYFDMYQAVGQALALADRLWN